MSVLISCDAVCKSHSSKVLFKDLSLSINKGDRIGLIGPNGSGKSTLLKILAGLEPVDSGTLSIQRGLKVGYVPQESIFPAKSLKDIVINSIRLPHLLEHEKEVQTDIVLSRLGFTDSEQLATTLSGGWKKRLEIAKQIINLPGLLLLDEPTNHLDLEGILWLEKFLERQNFTYVVISHDRYFLENVTSKVIEINFSYPKGIFSADGSYSTFLERREIFLAGQIEQEKSMASKVRREIEWLKQNPKARTSKSRARIQEAEKLQKEFADLKGRNVQTSTEIDFSSTLRATKKLLVAKNISKDFGTKKLFSHIDLTLTPGLRLGIIGANGTGKSTLLKLLSGQMKPDMGTIKIADGVKIHLFDQHREQLPLNETLRRALAPEGDRIIYRDQPIHVNSWAKKFLFSPDRLDLPISYMSGGERARVLIARLMAHPADILLLDEPTNDLDINTLETLEESIQDFPGAVVMITHDRYILEETCNLLLGIAPGGSSALLADYSQWENFLKQSSENSKPEENPIEITQKTTNKRVKLTYQEKREWEQMETTILRAEQEIKKLEENLHDLSIATDSSKLQEACQQLNIAQERLEKLYLRWQELENKNKLE